MYYFRHTYIFVMSPFLGSSMSLVFHFQFSVSSHVLKKNQLKNDLPLKNSIP